VLTVLHARERTGRGQVVDASLIEPLMTLLGPQIAAWDLLGELQPRTGNLSNHNAPRNVYATADGGWVAASSSATSIAERVLRLVGRNDLDVYGAAMAHWRLARVRRPGELKVHVPDVEARATRCWRRSSRRRNRRPRSTARATASPTHPRHRHDRLHRGREPRNGKMPGMVARLSTRRAGSSSRRAAPDPSVPVSPGKSPTCASR
jgi:crotonobetainyl-CoA:carnitine CoA-transferase CaiB-like acyl-CoA transferase